MARVNLCQPAKDRPEPDAADKPQQGIFLPVTMHRNESIKIRSLITEWMAVAYVGERTAAWAYRAVVADYRTCRRARLVVTRGGWIAYVEM
jgi:hypothetical protein